MLTDVERQNTANISNSSDTESVSADETTLEYASTQDESENEQDDTAGNNHIFEEYEEISDHENEEIEENDDEDASDGDNDNAAAEEEQINDNRPLYAGAPITVDQSMLLILSLVLKHNLTSTSIADIITVINLHCPNEALRKNNLYKFKKYFSWPTDKFTKHYYCSVCTGNEDIS